jgi:hypothetical protein
VEKKKNSQLIKNKAILSIMKDLQQNQTQKPLNLRSTPSTIGRSNYWGWGVLILLFGGLFMLPSVGIYFQEQKRDVLIRDGVRVKAVVTSTQYRISGSDHHKSNKIYYTFKDTFGNEHHSYDSELSRKYIRTIDKGDFVEIVFDQNNPKRNLIPVIGARQDPRILWFVGCLVLIFGMYMLFKGEVRYRNHRFLLKHGKMIEAKIIQKKVHRKRGKVKWANIKYEWTDSQGKTHQMKEEVDYWFIRHSEVGDLIHILVHDQKPGIAMFKKI